MKGKNSGHGREKGKGQQRRGKRIGRVGKSFFPAPGCEDPIVKMQGQSEICKMEGGREIMVDVSTKRFDEMAKISLQDIAGGDAFDDRRIEGECAKRIPVLHPIMDIQKKGGKIDRENKNESDDSLGKNRTCEKRENSCWRWESAIYPMISGYQEMGGGWVGGPV